MNMCIKSQCSWLCWRKSNSTYFWMGKLFLISSCFIKFCNSQVFSEGILVSQCHHPLCYPLISKLLKLTISQLNARNIWAFRNQLDFFVWTPTEKTRELQNPLPLNTRLLFFAFLGKTLYVNNLLYVLNSANCYDCLWHKSWDLI